MRFSCALTQRAREASWRASAASACSAAREGITHPPNLTFGPVDTFAGPLLHAQHLTESLRRPNTFGYLEA
jgi:hypothetical protein